MLEVPGAAKDTIEIGPGPASGTLSVKVDAPSKEPETGLLRAERGARSGSVRFQRILPIAYDADCTNAKASLADGILTISVPKSRAKIDAK